MPGIRRAISMARSIDVAARELNAALWQPSCCLVLLFISPGHDLAPLAAALSQAFGDTPLAGCTTSGEIGPADTRRTQSSASALPPRISPLPSA